jgi:hypothetical protein
LILVVSASAGAERFDFVFPSVKFREGDLLVLGLADSLTDETTSEAVLLAEDILSRATWVMGVVLRGQVLLYQLLMPCVSQISNVGDNFNVQIVLMISQEILRSSSPQGLLWASPEEVPHQVLSSLRRHCYVGVAYAHHLVPCRSDKIVCICQ